MKITDDMLPALLRRNLPKRPQAPIRFSLPAGYHEWQKMLMTSDIKLMVFPCATKVGKTLGGTGRLIGKSLAAPDGLDATFRTIAPTVALTRLTYQYLNRLVPENWPQPNNMSLSDYQDLNETWRAFTPDRSQHKGTMFWRHNSALIECIHGDNPEVTIEGARVMGNCFDEAAKLKKQVFDSAVSTTTQTNGWNCLYGTPRGKNFYYDLFMECQIHMQWAAKNNKPLEMFAMQARTIDNPFVPRETIARAMKYLSKRIFRQLFLAEFLDDGSVFVGHRDCIKGPLLDFPEEKKVQSWLAEGADEKSVVLGVDWAKRQDYYVAIAIDVKSDVPRVVGFQRVTGISYKKCVGMLYKFSQEFLEVVTCRHDRTGVGDVIDEMLEPLPFPIEPVVFSNTSKSNMVEAYMVALEEKDVELPNWPELLKEHDNFDVTTTSLGLPKYEASGGGHDDIIMALILAYFAVSEMKDSDFSVRILEDLSREKDLEKEEVDYLNDLINQFEDEEDYF
jgi:hypothetical protein